MVESINMFDVGCSLLFHKSLSLTDVMVRKRPYLLGRWKRQGEQGLHCLDEVENICFNQHNLFSEHEEQYGRRPEAVACLTRGGTGPMMYLATGRGFVEGNGCTWYQSVNISPSQAPKQNVSVMI